MKTDNPTRRHKAWIVLALVAVAIAGGLWFAGIPHKHEAGQAVKYHCTMHPTVVSRPQVGFLSALMEHAALTLCNDTGIMHIAGAVGAPCIALFGPTDPARWKPVNETVVAVKATDGHVESVSVDEVLSVALQLLS